MSHITKQIIEPDTGLCVIWCRGNPNTLGLKATAGSVAYDVTNFDIYMSDDSSTSSWVLKA
jgi:hypothetical protein